MGSDPDSGFTYEQKDTLYGLVVAEVRPRDPDCLQCISNLLKMLNTHSFGIFWPVDDRDIGRNVHRHHLFTVQGPSQGRVDDGAALVRGASAGSPEVS
jgi:hypothetical protein